MKVNIPLDAFFTIFQNSIISSGTIPIWAFKGLKTGHCHWKFKCIFLEKIEKWEKIAINSQNSGMVIINFLILIIKCYFENKLAGICKRNSLETPQKLHHLWCSIRYFCRISDNLKENLQVCCVNSILLLRLGKILISLPLQSQQQIANFSHLAVV